MATQITTLEPEDFNVFLLYLMDRYIQNPQERKALFGLISTLRENIAADLESAANHIAEVSRADLQVMLRRAALMLRNVTGLVLEPSVQEPLSSVAEEMGLTRADLIRTIVGDWLVANSICQFRLRWTRTARWKATDDQRTTL